MLKTTKLLYVRQLQKRFARIHTPDKIVGILIKSQDMASGVVPGCINRGRATGAQFLQSVSAVRIPNRKSTVVTRSQQSFAAGVPLRPEIACFSTVKVQQLVARICVPDAHHAGFSPG